MSDNNPQMATDEVVEAVAKALHHYDDSGYQWFERKEQVKMHWRGMAKAALSVIASKAVGGEVREKFDLNTPMTYFQALRDKQASEEGMKRMPGIMERLCQKRDAENDALAQQLTDRFLSWKLPKHFSPDAGIKFEPLSYHDYEKGQWLSGTNLFTATQAKEMFLHLLRAPYSVSEQAALSSLPPQSAPVEGWAEYDALIVAAKKVRAHCDANAGLRAYNALQELRAALDTLPPNHTDRQNVDAHEGCAQKLNDSIRRYGHAR